MKHIFALCLLLSSGVSLAADYEGGALQESALFPIGGPVSLSAASSPGDSMLAYSNVAMFAGQVLLHGGATLQVGNGITRLLADDLTPEAVGEADVSSFTFSVANASSGPITFRPRVRFWSANGPDGGPGDYYGQPAPIGFTFDPVTVEGGTVVLLTATVAHGLFSMPQGRFWAGVTFDNLVGTTGATLAQLDSLGQGIFGPPTVGTSTEAYFLSSSAGSFFEMNNPGGTVGFASDPAANFGWEFGFDVVTPTRSLSWGRIKTLYR